MIQRITMLSRVIMIVTLIGCSSIFLYLLRNDAANIIMTYAQMQTANSTQGGQKVSFLTDDRVLIVGTFYFPPTSKQPPTDAVILLHMLGRDRSDWNGFASTLSNGTNSFAALSIDLRGHGESINQDGKAISFQSFTPDDFNKMILDVKAAKHFLVTQKGISPNNIAIVGASIGANVALKYAAIDPSIKIVVLLSPGLDYKGVVTSDAITKYMNPIYIATTGKDPIAGSDPQTLCNEINCGNKLNIYRDGSSHGTDMLFESSLNPPLNKLIILWLNTAFEK